MKIDKSYLIVGLCLALVVSLLLNIRSCSNDPMEVINDNQRKEDSLYFANRQLREKVDLLNSEIKKGDSTVLVLKGTIDSFTSELKDLRKQVKRQKDIIADNDRKIKAIKNSDVKLSDSELTDFLNTKFPK